MNPRDDDPLHAAINAKLAAIVETSPTPPDWYDAWMHLSPESTEEERLAVYQAIRRCGTLPDEASFFLVSTLIDDMALDEAEQTLGDYEDRLRAIEKQYRLGVGGIWPSGTAPAGYDELRQQYFRAWGEVFARKLE